MRYLLIILIPFLFFGCSEASENHIEEEGWIPNQKENSTIKHDSKSGNNQSKKDDIKSKYFDCNLDIAVTDKVKFPNIDSTNELWITTIKKLWIPRYFYLLKKVEGEQSLIPDSTHAITGLLSQFKNKFKFWIIKDSLMIIDGGDSLYYFKNDKLDFADYSRDIYKMYINDEINHPYSNNTGSKLNAVLPHKKELLNAYRDVAFGKGNGWISEVFWNMSRIFNLKNIRKCEKNVVSLIFNGSVRITNPHNNPIQNSQDRVSSFLNCFWTFGDKTNSGVKEFFDQDTKQYIQNLMGENYKSSERGKEIKPIVKSLLLSYNEIGKDTLLLEKLSVRASSINVIRDDFYYDSLASAQVVFNLSDNNFHERGVRHKSRVSWCYSFWVRRYREKNSEVVYSLIKEFDAKMSEK